MKAKRTVLITGCSSGFGHELVGRFLSDGWNVVATLRRASERASLFEAYRSAHGQRLTVLELDVTSGLDRDRVRQELARMTGGRLDCLVNNAGVGLFGPLEETSEEQIRSQLEVNFMGTVLLTRALLPELRAARGKVINFSSTFGFVAFPLTSIYCATKYAIEGFSEALRHEMAPHGVQVGMVEPGGFRTRFGENRAWAEMAGAVDSVYRVQSRNYQNLHRSLTTRPARPITPVTDTVLRMSNAAKMPLRIRCGGDSKFAYLLKRMMPDRLHMALLGAMFKRVFLKPQIEGEG